MKEFNQGKGEECGDPPTNPATAAPEIKEVNDVKEGECGDPPSSPSIAASEMKEVNQVKGGGCGGSSTGPSTGAPGKPKDLGPVIRAPLDTKNYKAVELDNGLRALLVSTCDHQLDLSGCCSSVTKSQCKYQKIKEFNRTFLEINSHCIQSETSCLGSICGGNQEESSPPCNDPNCRTNSPNDPEQIKDPKMLKCCRGFASASICVGAGSFHDPYDIPGMAHLCEHCVFLGSKKYPQEGSLFQIAHKVNGGLNAVTHPEYTSFFVYSPGHAFETVLEPFADLMAQPLLKSESINKEVESVDSEFAIKNTCDGTRVYDFMGYLSKQCHPMGKFYWGNKKSLKVKNLQEKMIEWHKRYYCSNFMTLCLQGPLSIKELEELAVKYFSNIRNTGLPNPRDDLLRFGDPFTPETFSKIYHMVPVSNIRWMLISWCFPADLWQDFRSNPLHYVKVVLNTEGNGGIYNYLREKHWVTYFHSSCSTDDSFFRNTFCSIYRLVFVLTEDGLKNKDQILNALASYIKMLSQQGSKQRIFEELKRTQASIWHYNNWEEIFNSTMEMAADLQKVPPKYVLTSKTLVTKFNKPQIDLVLSLMDLDQANIIFIAREFATETNQKNIMNGRFVYTEHPISPEMQDGFKNISIYSDFKPPADNTFLSNELDCPHTEDFITIKGNNAILHKSDRLLINFFKNYKEYGSSYTERLPSATYNFYIYSPLANHDHLQLMEMWIYFLNVFVGRRINNAFNSLIYYFFSVEKDYIHLKVQGPSFHLVDLIEAILKIFEDFQNLIVDQLYFKNYKIQAIESFQNEILDNQTLSKDILEYLLLYNYRHTRHRIQALWATDYTDFCRYIRRFKSEMFIEMDVYGSISQSDFDKVAKLTESLTYAAYNRLRCEVERATLLPLGCKYLRIRAKHHAYKTSIIQNHYQFGCLHEDSLIEIWDLFYKILGRSVFHRLRTEEQLGYTIRLEKWYECGCRGLTFRVTTQPDKYTTEHVDSRIDKFIDDFYKIHFKDQKSFKELTSQYYPNKTFLFTLAKDMYIKYLLPNGEEFRKLSIQLVGFKSNNSAEATKTNPADTSDESVTNLEYDIPPKFVKFKDDFIMDIIKFKNTLELQPNHEEAALG